MTSFKPDTPNTMQYFINDANGNRVQVTEGEFLNAPQMLKLKKLGDEKEDLDMKKNLALTKIRNVFLGDNNPDIVDPFIALIFNYFNGLNEVTITGEMFENFLSTAFEDTAGLVAENRLAVYTKQNPDSKEDPFDKRQEFENEVLLWKQDYVSKLKKVIKDNLEDCRTVFALNEQIAAVAQELNQKMF